GHVPAPAGIDPAAGDSGGGDQPPTAGARGVAGEAPGATADGPTTCRAASGQTARSGRASAGEPLDIAAPRNGSTTDAHRLTQNVGHMADEDLRSREAVAQKRRNHLSRA